MDFRAKQIHPPKNWATFEDLCHALFKVVWRDPLAQKNGRTGQPQHGVDIFGGIDGDRTRYDGVQCKGKAAHYNSQATVEELLSELAKAEKFQPALRHWIFATTAPVDVNLQTAARELSVTRAPAGLFTVEVLGWEEIQALMATTPEVVKEFYPEAAYDLPAALETLAALAPVGRPQPSIWREVRFDGARDLGPALLGRPLGPADAAVCPRLTEADLLVSQLETAHSARLVGDPGAGKSVCAYQAALSFVQAGGAVYRLETLQSADISLKPPGTESRPCLFLIDDAHLLPPERLAHLETDARSEARLLTIHNAAGGGAGGRGAVVLDGRRAVRTIAEALRRNPRATLAAVRKADDEVGERMMTTSLERRIADAEATGAYPWQFCFILGGRWRRAGQAVDRARAAQADRVLAAVAMRQIVSRDAQASTDDITALCRHIGLAPAAVLRALDWLIHERLVLSPDDCRTPHQRFAAIAMHRILIATEALERPVIYSLAAHLLSDPVHPLIGIRNLLHEFHFGHGDHRWAWSRPLDIATTDAIAARCWATETPEEHGYASLVLTELSAFRDDWGDAIITPNLDRLATWMSAPGLGGYGLGYVHNHLSSGHKPLQTALTERIGAVALAEAFSSASREEIYGVGDLIRSTRNAATPEWRERFLKALHRDALNRVVRDWNEAAYAALVAHVCYSVSYYDDAFALDLVEAYLPTLKRLLAEDPVESFHAVDDIVMPILRIDDPLQVFTGAYKPDARRWRLGREICGAFEPARLAEQISKISFRNFQEAGSLLTFLRKCSPRKFAATVEAIDWSRLDETIGDEWIHPPHELEVVLGTLYLGRKDQEPVADFIARNLSKIAVMPPRLAVIAPHSALAHLAAGKRIALARWEHVNWTFGGFVIELVFEERPDLLTDLLTPYVADFARSLSRENASWFRDGAGFLATLQLRAPEIMAKVLDAVDVTTAAKGWADSLGKRGDSARSVAILVEAAITRTDPIGELARSLRKRFPSTSRPPSERPGLGRPRPGRRRVRRTKAEA